MVSAKCRPWSLQCAEGSLHEVWSVVPTGLSDIAQSVKGGLLQCVEGGLRKVHRVVGTKCREYDLYDS